MEDFGSTATLNAFMLWGIAVSPGVHVESGVHWLVPTDKPQNTLVAYG